MRGTMEDVVHRPHRKAARRTLLDPAGVQPLAIRALAPLPAGALGDDEGLHEIGPERGQRRPHAEHRAAARPREVAELPDQALLLLALHHAFDGQGPVENLAWA